MTLAAGPDNTVSTGYSRATSAFISVPSPLTIITGAQIDSARAPAQRIERVSDLRRPGGQ